MSAIFGVFHLDNEPVEAEELRGMAAALSHRGPEGGGAWRKEAVGFGHARLGSTAEAAREVQPLVHPGSGVVLVADARIDNRGELAAALERSASTASDGELILGAYLEWGEACVDRLLGDFAFVVWDPRKQSLFCARDPMGVKPLYYHRTERVFAFASEAKALFRLRGVSRGLDPHQVAIFLAWSRVDRESTLFGSVSRLPAAHTLEVGRGGASTPKSYWRLDPERQIRYSDPAEYVERFQELFKAAVRSRLRSPKPVGVALSGGLDSSSIACVARQLLELEGGSRLHAFSLTFSDLPSEDLRIIDERTFVQAVVGSGGMDWHQVAGDRLSPLRDNEQVLWHLDEPFAAPNLFLHWGMYQAAQRAGAGVFLDGLDGDSTVGHGTGRLNSLIRAGDWETFEAEVRAFAAHGHVDAAKVLTHFGLPMLTELARTGRWLSWVRAAGELSRRFPLSRRELILRFGLSEILPRRVGRRWRTPTGTPGTAGILRRPLERRLAEQEDDAAGSSIPSEVESHRTGLSQPEFQLTLEMADKSAAAFGIEPRYPFFDRRLMEFCLALPEEVKFAGGWSRLIFRRAMEGILPREIQWRAMKANLSPGFHNTFRSTDRAIVEETSFESLEQYLDPGALNKVRERYFADPRRHWGDPDGYLLFRATCLARWQASLST